MKTEYETNKFIFVNPRIKTKPSSCAPSWFHLPARLVYWRMNIYNRVSYQGNELFFVSNIGDHTNAFCAAKFCHLILPRFTDQIQVFRIQINMISYCLVDHLQGCINLFLVHLQEGIDTVVDKFTKHRIRIFRQGFMTQIFGEYACHGWTEIE